MGKPEAYIENYLGAKCKRFGFLYYKFVSPGHSGVPDRIVIGNGYTIFVELKKPGEKPRKLQEKIIENMTAHGAIVFTIDNKTDIDVLIHAIDAKTIEKG